MTYYELDREIYTVTEQLEKLRQHRAWYEAQHLYHRSPTSLPQRGSYVPPPVEDIFAYIFESSLGIKILENRLAGLVDLKVSAIGAALSELSRLERKVYELRYKDLAFRKPLKQVARQLNVSYSHAKRLSQKVYTTLNTAISDIEKRRLSASNAEKAENELLK